MGTKRYSVYSNDSAKRSRKGEADDNYGDDMRKKNHRTSFVSGSGNRSAKSGKSNRSASGARS